MAVLVLQALAIERGAPGGAAQQEAARLHVPGGPGQITDALEAEHRVIDVERHHDAVVRRIRRRRGDPAAHAAGLVDALLQDLPGLVLPVVHDLVLVDRGVLLTLGVVDADLAEQALHAEGARLVHQDGYHPRAQGLVAQQLRETAHVGLRGADLATRSRGVQHRLEGFQGGHGEVLVGLGAAVRQVAAQGLAPLVQVLHLRRVVGRLVERDLGQFAVRNGDVEAVAEVPDVVIPQLLGLVRRVLALTGLAHAPALDRLHQQDRRTARVLVRAMEGGVDLGRIMAAATQREDVLVAHLGHHLQRARIAAEEVLAHEGAVIGLEGLVVPVQRVQHHLAQRAVLVARQQRVPVAAPQQLDDVPTRAPELSLEFLHDLAVAAHRAVQALQIAVDDEDEVVQLFARRQPDGTQGLGFVHLAVTAEHPDLAFGRVGDAARMQVLQETRLVDGHQGPQAHGDRGELPELGHQLGVRVARQPLASHFLTEVQHLLLGDPSFQEGAGIDARSAVALDVEQIATMPMTVGMPEVVEAGSEEVRQRSEGTDVPAQITAIGGIQPVGLHHQCHRVPPHVGAQAPFKLQIPGAVLFLVGLDGVDVAGVGRERHVHAVLPRFFQQLLQQEMRAVRPFGLDDGGQCIQPLACFLGVNVVGRLAVGRWRCRGHETVSLE